MMTVMPAACFCDSQSYDNPSGHAWDSAAFCTVRTGETGSGGCPGGMECGHLLEGWGVALYFHAFRSPGFVPFFNRSR